MVWCRFSDSLSPESLKTGKIYGFSVGHGDVGKNCDIGNDYDGDNDDDNNDDDDDDDNDDDD